MLLNVALLLAGPAAGIVVGYVLGGRLAGLAAIRLRALWLLWAAAGVQAVQYYAAPLRWLLAVVFGLVAVWLAVNVRQPRPVLRAAGALILLGALLNGAAVLANGGMPYSPRAAAAAGLPAGTVTPKNRPGDGATRLAFIGDVVPVPPLHKVISPGDVLIMLGAATAIAAAMRRRTTGEVNHDARIHAAAGPAGGVPDRHDRDAAVHDRGPVGDGLRSMPIG